MTGHARGRAIALCLWTLTMALAAGCTNSAAPVSSSSTGGRMMGGSVPNSSAGAGASNGTGMMGGGSSSTTGYASAGERIFLTGVGTNGHAIPHTAPAVSQGSLMMGGGGCAACHGTNGRGATIRMMTGAAVKAPDIRYTALTNAGFTNATIRSALTNGTDESGKPLKRAMPRWQMSDADLGATIAYLKALDSQ